MKYSNYVIDLVRQDGQREIRPYRTIEYVDRSVEISHPHLLADDGDFVRTIDVDGATPRLDGLETNGISGTQIAVRPYVESDAMLATARSMPMPFEAMRSVATGEGTVSLQALLDDEGDVVTLAMFTDVGTWCRFGGMWQYVPPGQDPDPLDGYTVIDVEDGAVDVFDQADFQGRQVSAYALPWTPDEQGIGIGTRAEQPAEGTVTAGAEVLYQEVASEMPVIASIDDIPAAIEVGQADPSIRWYIDKRAAALGASDMLPWKDI